MLVTTNSKFFQGQPFETIYGVLFPTGYFEQTVNLG
jgi:hypothetical protein